MLNFAVLIIGLLLIGALWVSMSEPVNKNQTKKIATYFILLGIVSFTVQYFMF